MNNYFIYTPMLKRIIENAIIDTKENDDIEVTPNNIFLAILEEGEGIGIRILNNLGANIDELYQVFLEKENDEPKSSKKSRKKLLVYEYGIDLVEMAKSGKIDPVIGRDAETERLIEILLRKNKNNPLLLGDAGVGKTAIVENLALKILKHEVPTELENKKILSISMSNLVAGTKYRGEFEEKIEKIIREIENNPDLIIFIDEMHSIVGAGGAEGVIDAANILKPALARGKFKLIGATTLNEYKDTIEKDKALNRRFQTILIKEPNLEETKYILEHIKTIYENFHKVVVNEKIIDAIVNLSDKYIFNRKNPDKSIDILDEACTKRSLVKDKDTLKLENYIGKLKKIEKEKNNYIINQNFEQAVKLKEEEIILEDKINKLNIKFKQRKEVKLEDVKDVLKSKTNIPIYEIDKYNTNNLLKLEKKLKEQIIGQNEAISKLAYETIKIKMGLKNTSKPLSFLFVGKSGVGKTELVKVYANLLKAHLIRIDASEYNESHSISKIIGSPPGYVGFENVSVLDEVKNNPNSVILIDEIEKASSSFINLFLQILDDGFITNSSLEKIYFNHIIIIMTSNQASNINSIGFNNNKDIIIKNTLKEVFTTEFLNRLDFVINFNDLTKQDIKLIIEKELYKVKNKFKNQKIELVIQKQVVNDIIAMSSYEQYGARQIKKIIEDKVDNIVIDNLLINNKKIEISHI
ncbi:MAG: ATP-dependent Clp protease ATP-binding subunit [Bacilli bacterium]|nr:ATP-dependent Clp protease ATP-binding subunit [Bacilli bacterium]